MPTTTKAAAAARRAAAAFSALLYALTAIAMNFLNRWAVVFYPQPLVVLSLQMLAAVAIVLPLQRQGKIRLAQPLSWRRARELAAISVLYSANTAFALFGLKTLSIPAYSTLKRLTPAVVLAWKALLRGSWPARGVSVSVSLLVGGSLVAGAGDLAFDALGYAFALLSCTSQAAYLLLVEASGRGGGGGGGGGGDAGRRAAGRSDLLLPVASGSGGGASSTLPPSSSSLPDDNSTGGRATTGELLLYNALTSLPLLAVLSLLDGELLSAPRVFAGAAAEHGLLRVSLSVGGCALVGVALNYSLFLCTHHNSALSTTVVGGIKGLAVVALGAAFDGGSRFTVLGALGVLLNCVGGILYTAVKFRAAAMGGGGRGGLRGGGDEAAVVVAVNGGAAAAAAAAAGGLQHPHKRDKSSGGGVGGGGGGAEAAAPPSFSSAAPLVFLRRSALASASAEPLMAVAARADALLGGRHSPPPPPPGPAAAARGLPGGAVLADATAISAAPAGGGAEQQHHHHRHPHPGGEPTSALPFEPVGAGPQPPPPA
jgi:solute carrier family 35 protein